VRGLYVVLDPSACGARSALVVAEAALGGGCAMLQLRQKRGADRDRLALAREVRALAAKAGVPFVVNDRPDLARLAGADGLHLGQDDLSIADARTIVGRMSIGRSCHSQAQLDAAHAEGADVLALGPIFATTSKDDPDPVVGLDGLRAAARGLDRPLVAIGGIDLARAPDVAAAGASLGAVIGAVCKADDPFAAARALHRALGGSERT
jgi:thiamine-phosphate pyrophosphorylase